MKGTKARLSLIMWSSPGFLFRDISFFGSCDHVNVGFHKKPIRKEFLVRLTAPAPNKNKLCKICTYSAVRRHKFFPFGYPLQFCNKCQCLCTFAWPGSSKVYQEGAREKAARV